MADHSHQPATRGFVQLRLIQLATLLGLILIASFLVTQVRSVDAARATCERANLARVATLRLYNDLVNINQGRVDALKGTGEPGVADSNRYARRQYDNDRSDYIEAQSVAAVTAYGPGPNAVRVDCTETSPYPWPLSVG